MKQNDTDGRACWNANGGKACQERKPGGRGQAAHRALMRAGAILGAALLIGGMAAPLRAQSYPDRPIRLILPWSPGGTTDILGRIIGPKLAERLGQPVVIENRPGGGSHIGTDFVAKARPDGYTIVLVTPEITMGPSLYKKLNYDLIKDFAPISLVAQVPLIWLVKPSLPVKNLKELVEYARANPGKLTYGSGGMASSSHLAVELLRSQTGINMLHAPYKATGPGLVGLVAGEVDMIVSAMSSALPHIEAGKVRALAVLDKARSASLPNVPTSKEAGVDNVEVTNWWGILAPAATPRDIVNRLHAEWVKIAAMPDTQEKIKKTGCEPLTGGPEQFSQFLKAEVVRWAKIIKEANIPSLD